MRGNIIMCVHSVEMAKVVPAALGRLRLMIVATSERKIKKEQVYSRTFEGKPMQTCALEQLFCFVGMHDTVDSLTIHSALATGLGVEIQSLEVGISKFCTGEPEAVTLDLPGKGPVAKVYATLTFRPTEALHDSAADIERDAFGFEIVPLQRDTYRAHKDVLHKLSKDDTMRIEELLETGLHINRQQDWKRAVIKGVPLVHRGEVWLVSSQLKGRLLRERVAYNEIVARASNPSQAFPSREEIRLDLHRTYAGHPVFSTEQGQTSLGRVLLRYSLRNPILGYCQGLNFIAGLLLIAFWLLATLCEEMCPAYYSRSMNGAQADTMLLAELVAQRLPTLHAHFEKHRVTLSLVSMSWLITIFADVLPAQTTVRVWDVLFTEGGSRSVFQLRVALALLKIFEPILLEKKSFESIMEIFKIVLQSMWNSQHLLEVGTSRDTRCDRADVDRGRIRLLEQICDEKSRPRGSGPSFQPAEGVPTGSILSTTFSSWGKKFNSAIDSGKAKIDKFVRHVESLEAKSMKESELSGNASRTPISRPPLLAASAGSALATAEHRFDHGSEKSKEEIEGERLDREEALRVKQMERDVAAAAAKLTNSSAMHSNRDDGFFDGEVENSHQKSRSESLGSAVSAMGSVLQSTAKAVRRGSLQLIDSIDHQLTHLGERIAASSPSHLASPENPESATSKSADALDTSSSLPASTHSWNGTQGSVAAVNLLD